MKKQNNDRKNGKIMDKIAVIYYSLKGETIAPGMKIVNLEKDVYKRQATLCCIPVKLKYISISGTNQYDKYKDLIEYRT